MGLGERAFQAVLLGFGLEPRRFRAEVEDSEGTRLPNGSRAFAVYHCGTRVLKTHRTLDQQRQDWERLRPFIRGPA